MPYKVKKKKKVHTKRGIVCLVKIRYPSIGNFFLFSLKKKKKNTPCISCLDFSLHENENSGYSPFKGISALLIFSGSIAERPIAHRIPQPPYLR